MPREVAEKKDVEIADQGPEIVLASDVLPSRLVVIPMQAQPVFPGVTMPMIFPAGPYAQSLVEAARDNAEHVVALVMTKEPESPSNPEDIIDNLHTMGTAARIMNIREAPDGGVQVIFQGVKRCKSHGYSLEKNHVVGIMSYPLVKPNDSDEVKAMVMGIVNTLRELVKHNPVFGQEIKMFLTRGSMEDSSLLADFAVNMTTTDRTELQNVLDCVELKPRLEKVLFLLRKEQDINELKEKIQKQIEEKISKQQREFFLKEQLKAIKEELGLEKDDKTEEIEKLQSRIEKLTFPEDVQHVIDEEMGKLHLLSNQSPEYAVSRNYLEWLTGLPWGITTPDKLDVSAARKILDRDHYGLKDVKERILEFIGVSKLKGTVEGSILCLVGPPGVGKTSLGKAVAESLGRKFFRFSLGGMRDEAEIKGHRRTYIGALPGKVMQALKSCGSQNPVIMLDEIDKVGASFQGDPASALLEVLDPEQNNSFRDHYLDVPFDLSKVLFIATANVPDTIPGPLLDRMEVIRLSGYTLQEKQQIAKRHLVPRLLRKTGISRKEISFTDAGLKRIVEGYAREAGVRNLEKAINTCMRKVAAQGAEHGFTEAFKLNTNTVEELLGKPVFHDDPLAKNPKPGVVTGLAWTALGGSTLFIESIGIPGKYGLKQTGQLGDVMIESSNIAFSYITSQAEPFGLDPDFLQNNTLHLHVPAGATPKDGPSAGVTMATSLISLATGKKVSPKLAMTGELTLTGLVLPVGGIREKVLAAKRSKVKTVILPEENRRDFEEIPEEIRNGIEAHFVTNYGEVYELVFGQ